MRLRMISVQNVSVLACFLSLRRARLSSQPRGTAALILERLIIALNMALGGAFSTETHNTFDVTSGTLQVARGLTLCSEVKGMRCSKRAIRNITRHVKNLIGAFEMCACASKDLCLPHRAMLVLCYVNMRED